jgi:hypothetical protein
MSLRTLRLRAALLAHRPEVAYTLTQLKAEPLTAAHVPVFEALLSDWEVVHRTSLTLIDAIAQAQARIDKIDVRLDNVVSRIFKAAMTLANDNRDHALVVRYFGKDATVKEIQRPVLGTELVRVRGWVKSLKESEHASLAALGVELEAVVA